MIKTEAMTASVPVNAATYLKPRNDVIVSARELAEGVLRITRTGAPVLISFEDMRGVASTFFNTLFEKLLGELGSEQFDALIECRYGTRVQEQAAKRSLDAVRGDAA